MEKLGQPARPGRPRGPVGPHRRRHPAVPVRAGLPRCAEPARGLFLDGRFIRLISAPARASGRVYLKVLGAGIGMASTALTKVLGGQMLSDVQTFVAALDSMFGGFRERADLTHGLLRDRGTAFVVVATRSGMHCGRPPSSSSGSRPTTCRWPGWSSTGCSGWRFPELTRGGRWPGRS